LSSRFSVLFEKVKDTLKRELRTQT